MEITIRVQRLNHLQVKNGRIKAGEGLHLDVSRIRRVFAWRRKLYVAYETDKIDYYRQFAEEPPPYAVELRHEVEKYEVDVCNKCKSVIEWDADEPFCPRGCHDHYDDWSYTTEVRRRLVIEAPRVSQEVGQFVEKAFKVKAELATSEFRNLAGGCRPLFKLAEVDFSLYQVNVVGLGVVNDPEFECSDYDSFEIEKRRYDGKYIAVRVTAGTGLEVLLYKFEGEPDLSVMHQLHEEYMAKKREEEERRRKAEEEARRRMEEEERKWGNPAKVAEAIKAALPQWADGAVVVAKSVSGEDRDVYYNVYPIKRSQRGSGYYYSPEWRRLQIQVPDRYMEKLADHIILRDGRVVKVQKAESSGRYVALAV
jgi:Ni/Co efflux regulator RcnB